MLAALVCALALAAGTAAGAAHDGRRVFYLSLTAGECVVRPTAAAKNVSIVPCTDSRHNLEVYAVRHGGWGQGGLPTAGLLSARAQYLCLTSFVDVTGHGIPPGYGWQAFWPDAGDEQRRFGDRVICSLSRGAPLVALGAGRHIRASRLRPRA